MVLVVASILATPAAAQRKPSAITCDYYKKQIGEEITRSRRAEQTARHEAERDRITQGMGMDQGGYQQYQDPYGAKADADPGPPRRDYGAVDQLRREGEMLCAQRKYPQGIGAYKKALGLLGVKVED